MSKKNYPQNCLVLNIFTIKKAAVVLNLCLIEKIQYNFLVPRIVESGRKTFMPIQTLWPTIYLCICKFTNWLVFTEFNWKCNFKKVIRVIKSNLATEQSCLFILWQKLIKLFSYKIIFTTSFSHLNTNSAHCTVMRFQQF